MQFIIILCQCIIICSYKDFVDAKPLAGSGVKQLTTTEFPYVAAIGNVVNNNTSLVKIICMGVFITPKHVITAEHCLEDANLLQMNVIAGSFDLTNCERYNLVWWLTYDQWAIQTNTQIEFPLNDVAIMKLYTTLDNIMHAIVTYFVPNSYLYGLDATIVTWTTSSSGHISNIMEKGTVNILSNEICQQKCMIFGQETVIIPERMLCSFADPYVILTSGDSGSPLIVNGGLIAINSGVYPSTERVSHHSTRVNYHFGIYYYKVFIESVMNMS